MSILFWTALSGIVILLPFAMAETWTHGLSWKTPSTMLTVVWTGVFPGLLSYLAHDHVVKKLGGNKACLMLYLGPVYAVALGWLLLDETLQWFDAVGAALILPSIYLAGRREAQPTRTN